MAPSKLKPASEPSNKSTRSSNPQLVPAGEFKQGSIKKTVGPGDPDPPQHAPSVPGAYPGVIRSVQLADDGSAENSSKVEPQSARGVDREGLTTPRDQRVEPVPHLLTRGESPASYTPRKASSLSVPPAGRTQDTPAAWPVQPRNTAVESRPVRQDAPLSGTQGLNFRQDMAHGSNAPRELSARGTFTQYEPRYELTLHQVRQLFQTHFAQTERVVDSNAKLVVYQMTELVSGLVSSLFKDIANPVSESVQALHRDVVDNFKSIKFSHSRLESLHKSIVSSVSNTDRTIVELRNQINNQVLAGSIQKKGGELQTVPSVDVGVLDELKHIVEIATALVLSTAGLDPISREQTETTNQLAEVIQVIQQLDQKVEHLTTTLSSSFDTSPLNNEMRELHKKIDALNGGAATKPDIDLSDNTCIKMVFAMQKVMESRLEEFSDSIVRKVQDLQKTQDATTASQHESELEQKIDDSSEGHRLDFLNLNEKIDQLINHHKLDTAKLREEIKRSTFTGTSHHSNKPTNDTHFHASKTNYMASESVNIKLQKQLVNAITKSDWPKLSG
jgi:hypothetical protein